MRDIPSCKACKLKCHGCEGYSTCLMRQEVGGARIEDCGLVVSKYHMYEKYLNNHTIQVCRYHDECKSLAKAWE